MLYGNKAVPSLGIIAKEGYLKVKKLSAFSICMLLLMLALCGCQKKEQQDGAASSASSDSNILSDQTLLKNILPGLEDVEKTCWVEKAMGNPNVVGPTDYSEVGYAKLTDAKAKEILDSYTWTDVSFEAQADGIDTSELSGSKWMVCKDFTNAVLADSYLGTVYFNGSTVWFDVITK